MGQKNVHNCSLETPTIDLSTPIIFPVFCQITILIELQYNHLLSLLPKYIIIIIIIIQKSS